MASIASNTLAINAAFLQEIKEDHYEMRELEEVVRTLASETHPSVERMTEALAAPRDRLSLHFALEEAYGYCEADLTETPWLSEKAAALKSEHIDLFLAISKRVNEAERLRYHEAPRAGMRLLCDEIHTFCDHLDAHERRETELILESLDDDVGVGD